jgi:hypothetical protein
MQRIFALLLALFFLGLIGVMASVTFFIRDPLPVLSPRVPVTMPAEAAGPVARAEISVDGAYRYEILFDMAVQGGPPELALTRPGSDALPLLPDVTELSPSSFQASGQFNAPGRWQVNFLHAGQMQEFAFILRE